MNGLKMCEFCGVRPAKANCTNPKDARRIRARYCEVCRPIVYYEMRRELSRVFRQEPEDETTPNPAGGEESSYRRAYLKNIGLDYLELKRGGLIQAETEELTLMEAYEQENEIPGSFYERAGDG